MTSVVLSLPTAHVCGGSALVHWEYFRRDISSSSCTVQQPFLLDCCRSTSSLDIQTTTAQKMLVDPTYLWRLHSWQDIINLVASFVT